MEDEGYKQGGKEYSFFREMGGALLRAGTKALLFPWIIPTGVRQVRDFVPPEGGPFSGRREAIETGYSSGTAIGAGIDLISLIYLVCNHPKETLAALAVTNTLSGIHEVRRYKREKQERMKLADSIFDVRPGDW